MAMDKSKESTRVEKLINMTSFNPANSFLYVLSNIKNPSIFNDLVRYIGTELVQLEIYRYAVAAGLIDQDDFEWIKENINFEDHSGEPMS